MKAIKATKCGLSDVLRFRDMEKLAPKDNEILFPGQRFSRAMKAVCKEVKLFQMPWPSLFGIKKTKFFATGMKSVLEFRSLLNELKKLLASGQLKLVIERCYSLEEVVVAH